MLEQLKKEVWECNLGLKENGLVYWSSGNVSGRDKKTGYVVIKPSGIKYKNMQPADMVVVDLDGKVIEGDLTPSSDTDSHLVVYRNRSDVGGIAHTHSYYATAFAVIGDPIPAFITAMAENFGKEIPMGAYAPIGGDEIGDEIIRSIGDSTAILMKGHGVFTIGKTPEKALKSAVLVEATAKTYWLALQIGKPEIFSDKEVARHYEWYKTSYGQK
jgi:L-ribulose-5-phosphate 4-epimerase